MRQPSRATTRHSPFTAYINRITRCIIQCICIMHAASLLCGRSARSASCCSGLTDALQHLTVSCSTSKATPSQQHDSMLPSWLASSRRGQSTHTLLSSSEVHPDTNTSTSDITTHSHRLTASSPWPSHAPCFLRPAAPKTSSALPHSLCPPASHPSPASLQSAATRRPSCGRRSSSAISLSWPLDFGLDRHLTSSGSGYRCMATDAPTSSSSDLPASVPSPATATASTPVTPSPADAATGAAAGAAFSYGPRKVTLLRRSGDDAALEGTVHISNSLNNIHISLTDQAGDIKAWASAGTMGFKNARKRQPIAAERYVQSKQVIFCYAHSGFIHCMQCFEIGLA